MRLTIGTLAARSGVHLETIRYYERIGLMPEPGRTVGGDRQRPGVGGRGAQPAGWKVGHQALIVSPSNTAMSPNWVSTPSLSVGRRNTKSSASRLTRREPVSRVRPPHSRLQARPRGET